MRSIDLIVNILADAIVAGKTQGAIQSQQAAEGADVKA
jgi:ribosomal protein S2